MALFDQPIEPMTLGNMCELGVRSLFVSCWLCHRQAVLTADRWPDDVAVSTFGPPMVCTGYDIAGADASGGNETRSSRVNIFCHVGRGQTGSALLPALPRADGTHPDVARVVRVPRVS
jgi:hypothetical protein